MATGQVQGAAGCKARWNRGGGEGLGSGGRPCPSWQFLAEMASRKSSNFWLTLDLGSFPEVLKIIPFLYISRAAAFTRNTAKRIIIVQYRGF